MRATPASRPVQPTVDAVLSELKANADLSNVGGMARYGISVNGTLGVSMPIIRSMAKRLGKRHVLAIGLWDSGVHEARILAALVEEPAKVTFEQAEKWVKDIDSWDVCDQLCGNLFDKTSFGYELVFEWVKREEEFVRRAGFVLMTQLAVHDKKASNERFLEFLPLIENAATDNRNFVKKAVNWALRQIGKRNSELNVCAIEVAKRLAKSNDKASRWIAADAMRELQGEAVQRRIAKGS